MKTQISFQVHAEYLKIVLCGEFPSTTYRELLESMRDQASRSGHTRLLIDAMGVTAPLKELSRFFVGEAVADIFKHNYRVAALYRPELINKFVENVAVNRGTQFLVVGDETVALQWLLSR